MTYILHQILKEKKTIPPENMWPDSWNTVCYKIYERCKIFIIKDHDTYKKSLGLLGETLLSRRSADIFSGGALQLDDVLNILKYSAGTQNESVHRTYASGGALYPIEIYYINNITTGDFEKGVYHFNPGTNSFSLIKRLLEDTPLSKLIGSTYTILDQASGILCFTAVTGRVTDKYGWLGIRLCLFDIGQIIQNISLVAETLGFAYRPIAGFNNEKVENLTQVDGLAEVSLLVYAIGNK